MGLRAGRLAFPSRGVLQLLWLPPLLLLLLSSGARGAAAQGDSEVPTLYLWKTVSDNVTVSVISPLSQILSLTVKGMSAEELNGQLD
ncbi:hypothetical protein STEG23_034679 [Scotinomys teguina]